MPPRCWPSWPAGAPFDAIVVAAAAPVLPPALREQLEVGGRLVIPIGVGPDGQRLCRITRRAVGADQVEDLGGVVFVPLVGARGGWPGGRPLARH